MGRFKEYLKKNTFKQTFGDVFKDYDLKQCVLMKEKINKHGDKVYTLSCLASFGILVPFFITHEIMRAINGPEGGLIQPGQPEGVIFIVVALFVFVLMSGYTLALGSFRILLTKRIKEIAGVTDNGEEEKGTD